MPSSNSNLPNDGHSEDRPFGRVSESLLRFLGISNGKAVAKGSAPLGCDAIELEARVLYSGSPLPADLMTNTELLEAVADLDVSQMDANNVTVPESPFQTDIHELLQSATDSLLNQSNQPVNPTATELIFIDAGVQQLESLLEDIQANYAHSNQVQVVLIEASNGIQQITDTLLQYRDLRSVHIVSHGNEGSVQLGDTALTNSSLAGYAGSIASWSDALSTNADILFYGCNLAATADGQELVDSLAELTSADVAASDDLTGHKSLDGDWDLEYVFGELQTEVFASATLQSTWRFSLATITVDTTADYASSSADWGDTTSIAALLADKGTDNLVTLREAIEASNNTATAGTPNNILFNIADDTPGQYYYANDFVAGGVTAANVTAVPTGGEAFITDFDPDHPYSWFRIDLAPVGGELNITESVIIDGYSQWGASENTLAVGSDAVVRIEVTNTSADGNRGFHFEDGSDGTTIQGLAINRFGAAAVLTDLGADGNTFRGNHIGTDVTGTIGHGNQEGIHLRSADNSVGGADVADRNVIADNSSRGVITFTFASTIVNGNVVQNNYIGVDSSGMVQLGNGGSGGIQVYNQDGMQILDNVISGNSGDGITLLAGGDAFNTVVQGNYIGVAVDGATIVQNGGNGIEIASDLATGNLIGGTLAGQGNIIAGNVLSGIELDGAGVTGTTIVGNFIGTNMVGDNLGNGENGIVIVNGSTGNTIGGILAGQANAISFNTMDGVLVDSGTNNTIRGNQFIDNQQLAVNLAGGIETMGVTANDGLDADTGANDLQNFPIIDTATVNGMDLSVSGSIIGTPSTNNIIIDLYWSNAADGSGHGEAEFYLGFLLVNTNAAGVATFSQNFTGVSVPVGAFVTATATNPNGSTSEFALNHVTSPFNVAPLLGNNQLTLNEGDTIIINSSNLNASDANDVDSGLEFTVSAVTGGHFALFVDQVTPILTFTKAQVDAGDIVFVDDGDEIPPSYDVTVSDGVLTDGPEPATINFTNVNDEPVISGPVTATTNEDAAGFNVNLLDNATDPDGDTLNAVGVTKFGPGDDGGITVFGNQLVVDPSFYNYLAVGDSVVINYTYTVEDGNGGSQPQTATLTIDGRNDAPTVAGPISQAASEDDAGFSVDMMGGANDIDTGDSLTITNLSIAGDDRGITRVGDDLVVEPSQYNFLAVGESVTVTYTYDIEDLDGDSVSQTTTIVINGANDNPDPVTPISTSFSEDAASQLIDLLQSATDPDTNDTLSVISLNLDSGDDRGVTYGVDQLTIDPNAYADLAPAESETLVYSYQISDGNGGTVSQTATIVITGVNDTPAALDDSDVTVEDNAVTTDVLANDYDVDNGQTLTVTIPVGGEPTNGTAVVNGDNTITYTPNLNYVGGDLINYQIDDGNGGITTAVLSINVLPDNDPPYVDNPIGLVTVNEDAADTVIDLTTVFNDVDDPVLSYNLVSNSNTGLVNVSFSGTDLVLEYQLDQFGDATIEIQAVDGSGQTVNEVFTVRVDPINDAPIVFNPAGPWNVDEDAANTVIDLTTIFSDVDDIVLSYTFSNDNPALVDASLTGDNLVLDYLDDANGTANITVEAIDAAGESITHVIQTSVAPVNDAPIVTNSAYSTSPTEAIVGNAFAGAGDIDSASYSAVLISPPANGSLTLNPDGTFVFVPDSAFIGQVSFQFMANDGVDNSTPGEVVIDILAPIVPETPPVDVSPPEVEDPDPIEPITSTPDAKVEKEPSEPKVETPTTIVATPFDSGPDTSEIEVATLPSLADLFGGQPDRYYGVTIAEIDLQVESELMPEVSFEVAAYDAMLFASLDTLGDELDEVASNASIVLVTSIVSMSGLSIGVVSWILRSGALLTSLLAQMPAWRLIDPLTVLGYSDEDEEKTESVQDIIDGVGSDLNEINELCEISATNLAQS